MVRALGVIPARFASTRFPGKPLAPLGTSTVLEHVWRGARAARRLERVVVATDDDRIADACAGFGAECLMTSPAHVSGSDRVAEVARHLGDVYGIVVNIQGDEPFVTGTSLDRLVDALVERPALDIATLVEPFEAADEVFDPNTVKVVAAMDGRALYFSRSPIPYLREPGTPSRSDFRAALAARPAGLGLFVRHQGIYAYRREALFRLTALAPSPLELHESLEQLRALETGMTIGVVASDFRSIAVDTKDDLERARARLEVTKEAP